MDLLEKNSRSAIGYFRAVLAAAPEHASAQNNLAWILATARDDALRDGAEALALAGDLAAKDTTGNPMFLDTLAAAQAETGEFNAAVATARRGIELARAAGNEVAAEQIEARLPFYERGEAYRE
jgi:tetratricopeptide (TPR) repeat protein